MDIKIHLSTPDDWFKIGEEIEKIHEQFPSIKVFVSTGARGCGKTQSTHKEIKKLFDDGQVGLYIRNVKRDVPSARQYFAFLGSDNETIVTLGSLGASTVVLEDKENEDKTLIAYTLFLGEYEVFKSSKRHVDYIVYEEFSSFTNGASINRVFALTELMESIRQTRPDFTFFALSNNIFKDDLFDHLLDSDQFVHWQITKKTPSSGIKNKAIKSYLEGEYLVPDLVINLSRYRCMGFVTIAATKLYVYEWELGIPKYVLSSSGSGKEMKLDTEIIQIIRQAHYRSLKERNRCEFVVGLVTFADAKLRA